ncbi:MAG: ester cyclase [Actinomycetota bacterium]
MGEARKVMDRVTKAAFAKDTKALGKLYAPDAIADTPDQGEIKGRDEVVTWVNDFMTAFPDARYDSTRKYESGDTAIDEGYFTGTHTGPLQLPDGTTIPATGKRVSMRSCDMATCQDGLVTRHRFYFDQVDFLTQLGLMPEL